MRRYLMSMGIRTACFVLAVVAIVLLHWTVVGWIMVVAAVLLPYVAVVMANATRSVRGTYLGPIPADRARSALHSSPVSDMDDKDKPE